MVNYEKLGFKSFENFLENFLNTLLLSNKTYEYFVDWSKVKNNVKKYLDEISLLNSLTKIPTFQREEYLKELINRYPKTIETIPMLVAERVKNKNLDIFEPETEKFITINFSKVNDKKTILKIVDLCKKIGIIDLFDEVKDIYDYLLGLEVGLDSNARKNRSGEIFEKIVQKKIIKILEDKYEIIKNDKNFSLYPIIEKEKGEGKTHDIVIYLNKNPVLIIECSFYNVSGSKPISIAESYPEMSKVAKNYGIEFLWVSDGPAWFKMKESLIRSMEKMDWILNFKMLNYIEKILK